MERVVYDRMAELDGLHWWYRARRRILEDLIRRKIPLAANARILEIGCGTGHNLDMLGGFGRVDAIEIDGAARALASSRLGHAVLDAPLPELPGVPNATYDLITILDVLEHVEDDRAALRSMAAKLKPGGKILITVPAHPWMWSAHDVVNHHKRRYTRRTLRTALTDAGLRVEMLGWFNSLLFPLAAAARLAGRLTGKEDSDDK
ncbi:MAG: class I SAM-dependent methyltransferase, partial [Alphaproteobacteria bacterium]